MPKIAATENRLATPKFVTQEAAASRWSVSVFTIRRLIASGKITGYRLNGRVIRVSLDEVDSAFQPIPTVIGVE